ncbi:hypothetical protein DOTSEDRAFT_54458 [Dothistroma septosporum NZE10]|uniref:F-box domain-containing protein n=1 Tax=Dothistroma septosporum (strain NZE10 / CBS 128990) TaxID=675120 RepID=N1PK76_DOTSN|nr:hypothetical protein DOTSEDRAFT_54458 [Dothistroma septosporum NZE10]
MMSAASQVLGTVELLECVLAELDMQTLLHSQRVNCTFRNTIQKSSRLRQRLWLEPGDGAYFLDERLIDLAKYPRVNPLLDAPQVLDIAMFSVDVRCISYGGLRHEPSNISMNGGTGPVVNISARGTSLGDQPEIASWRDMLVVSQHEPHFQFQVWRKGSTSWLASRGPVMYFQKSPTVQQVLGYANGEHRIFMVSKDDSTSIPAKFSEVEKVLKSWRAKSTTNNTAAQTKDRPA